MEQMFIPQIYKISNRKKTTKADAVTVYSPMPVNLLVVLLSLKFRKNGNQHFVISGVAINLFLGRKSGGRYL